MPEFDAARTALQETRQQLLRKVEKVDQLIIGLTELDGGPATQGKPKARAAAGKRGKAKGAKSQPPGKRSPDPKRQRALEHWNAGKTVPWIAAKLKLRPGGIYYWKKVDQWPDQPEAADDSDSEDD